MKSDMKNKDMGLEKKPLIHKLLIKKSQNGNMKSLFIAIETCSSQ